MRKYSLLMMLGLLSMLLIGLQLPALPTATLTIEAEQVKFEPKLFDIHNPDPIVTVHIKFPEPYERNTTDVDPSTVLLEGFIPPSNTWTTRAPPEFVAEFNGGTVAAIIWAKIYHMGLIPHKKPGVPAKIELHIIGKLFNGTDWHGIGKIKIVTPEH
ncbi:MAG: hypothetical protein JSV85_07135 [Candidatus Bathyarchaeota archaeon]|nr:MAG: hypothetical protein JSV85_07135 [Candidatus Bathyarchaeota archaeon]